MRQLLLHLDDNSVGCGAHVLLVVAEGREWVRLLHVPTLTRVRLHRAQVAAQLRSGAGAEVPVTRGLISRIERRRREANRYGRRYPARFVEQALDAAREAQKNLAAVSRKGGIE